ncbi:hypothetical protein PT974_11086 [Cladobotryum mycophilum]|uniref:AB hydrolase-1 domain-containing protein n=1 Tax=Cladobotryum mycophilum TaxID=491253 RepID=A0ABR0SBL8_9HYPO
MPTPSLLLAVLAAVSTAKAATTAANIDCHMVEFPVTATANNEDYGNDFDPNNATSIVAFIDQALNTGSVGIVGQVSTTASLSISAQYCGPAGATDLDTIQVLVHGNTCNKAIWDALYQPQLQNAGYSYQRFFASQGYASLAIDLPGHGNSTHPDPNTVAQIPLQAAVISGVTSALRTANNPLGTAFRKVIFGGHSFGSITGVAAARFTPDFADALILTGWSVKLPLPNPLLQVQLQPAALLFDRFRDLPLGYVTSSNFTGHEETFFAGDFDPSIPPISFATQDIMTCGEGGSIGEGLQPASGFKGKVFAISGELDDYFCNAKNGDCADQLAASKALVPDASLYETYPIPNTGHDFMFHHSSTQAFQQIQQFIEKNL